MTDKYEILSVKSPVITPLPGYLVDTFTNWVEIEIRPYLEPGIAAIGGYDARRKILVSHETYLLYGFKKGQIIEMSFLYQGMVSFNYRLECELEKQGQRQRQASIPHGSSPKRSMQDTIENMITQLERLNRNLEKRDG